MATSSTRAVSGVVLPTYPLVEGDLMRALENAAAVRAGQTDDEGEQYAMEMVKSITAAEVPVNSMIVIPLSAPRAEEVLDFTYLASSKSMYFQIHEKPQNRMTYGHCSQYSVGITDFPLPIGALVKFPSMSHYLVAQPRLSEAVRISLLPAIGSAVDAEPAKRPCLRPLEIGGEQAEDTAGKIKGMSIVDLDGGEHPTRNKTDLHQRERDLGFVFRAMDVQKRNYSVRADVTLQADYYRSMLFEQGDTQLEDRHVAFTACGLMNRVQKLPVLGDNGRLKLLLIGSVLADNNEATLGLEDFICGERISSKPSPCPSNNAGLVTALKNFQMVMHLCFSDFFEDCLDAFIDNLEGVCRPMELVSADFLKHSVELNLKRFFREVSTEKGSALPADLSLKTPERCALHLTGLFYKLGMDLADHPLMVKREAYFRVRMVRLSDAPAALRTPNKKDSGGSKADKPSVNFLTPTESKSDVNVRPCVGHLGSALGAVTKDGRPYSCKFGKDCAFKHVAIESKSKQKLLDIVGSLTAVARADLTRAVVKRS